ncbi:MAG TPA: response regulator [Pyrinomonadaceae bacterium]|jgi:FixJ family two-component response regulator
MKTEDRIVFVLDDDFRIREALTELFASINMPVVTFERAAEYIEFPKPDLPACLILDINLPDISGLELQKQLADSDHPPIVFITGHGDIPSSVRAIKAGAVDFLTKPFNPQELLNAIQLAITKDLEKRRERAEIIRLEECYSALTPREREVLPLIVSGLLNKQAAAELGISEITVQIHRSKIMQKMGAKSFAELVRIAAKLKIPLVTKIE